MSYDVFIVAETALRIRQQAEYIATEQQAPKNAAKWLARVLDTVDSLAEMPRRFAVAQEDA